MTREDLEKQDWFEGVSKYMGYNDAVCELSMVEDITPGLPDIRSSFVWAYTPQGMPFWQDVYWQVRNKKGGL